MEEFNKQWFKGWLLWSSRFPSLCSISNVIFYIIFHFFCTHIVCLLIKLRFVSQQMTCHVYNHSLNYDSIRCTKRKFKFNCPDEWLDNAVHSWCIREVNLHKVMLSCGRRWNLKQGEDTVNLVFLLRKLFKWIEKGLYVPWLPASCNFK